MESQSEVVALQARSLQAEVLRDIGDMQGALAAVDRALAVGDHPDITARLRAEARRSVPPLQSGQRFRNRLRRLSTP